MLCLSDFVYYHWIIYNDNILSLDMYKYKCSCLKLRYVLRILVYITIWRKMKPLCFFLKTFSSSNSVSLLLVWIFSASTDWTFSVLFWTILLNVIPLITKLFWSFSCPSLSLFCTSFF